MRNDKGPNLIVEMTFEFAVKILELSSLLEKEKKYILSRQVLRSGTSIGANVREAQNAESKADFIHKMKIAAKEADETEYWLLLLDRSGYSSYCKDLFDQCGWIIRVLSKIIASSKNRRNAANFERP
jgi:four helix bundle protein